MLRQLLAFELGYWLRRPMVYVFLLINLLLVFFALTSDNVTVGESYGSIHKNAPFVIQAMYANMSLIGLLMTTAFVQAAALRDFNYKTHEIIFSTPLRKSSYLTARFLGAYFASLIPLLGVSVAGLLASLAFWVDPSQLGPVNASGHVWGLLLFAIPNNFLIAVLIFGIASLSRSTIASFVGAIAILVAYGIAGTLAEDLENEQVAMLVDPFALNSFQLATKYWTVADKNSGALGPEGLFLVNRLIYLLVAIVILAITFFRFSFTPRSRKKRKGRKEAAEDEGLSYSNQELPDVQPAVGFSVSLRQVFSQARIDLMGVLRSTPFLVILLFGTLNMIGGLSGIASSFYGLDLYPVTYRVINTIQGTMYISTVGILIFYSGALIWKERDAKVDEIYNSLPYPDWVPVWSKMLALLGVLAALQLLCITTGVVTQTIMGYHRYDLGVYLTEFMIFDLLAFFFTGVAAMLIHTLINNKYLAYFVVAVFLIVQAFIWVPLDITSNMVAFGGVPGHTYSDMNGFGPFVPGKAWFNAYWLLFSLLLLGLTVFFWIRSKDTSWGMRRRMAGRSFNSGRVSFFSILGVWVLAAGIVYYNTEVLNTYVTPKEGRKLAANYEKTFSYLRDKPQPFLVDVQYEIDLYPEKRDVQARGTLTMVNLDDEPIDTLILNLTRRADFSGALDRGRLAREIPDYQMALYAFEPVLQPGDTAVLDYEMILETKGFENEVSNTQIVQNGTFFNNSLITPTFGYQPDRELSQKRYRKKFDLPEREQMPALEENCTENCRLNYIGQFADFAHMETVISTTPDQIAVAPGSLVEEWEEEGRKYFRYRVDHPSIPFCSFISADFEVERDRWNDVDLEVYYQKEHDWNVENMVRSMRKSLSYYSENFGPYRHKQARIIEFPRYASFAQAFPGTMPYSESIGFIAEIDTASTDIDMVFYVVAHEMGHQWWAHQVIGANMQGATLLSETLSQYSALMVMEKEYGRERMQRFLKFEMDNYLQQRGSETEREKPLMEVYANQGYIHYRKGSAVMYYLKEMIGEDQVNAALRELVDSFAYQKPPYPTAHHLVDNLAKRTPDSLQYLIEDMFETITLFNNRSVDPTYRKLDNGQYEVTINVKAAKFRADSLGRETEIPIRDYLDIAVYGKPEKGEDRGSVLYWKRHLVNQPDTELKVTVDSLPWQAGVDPNYYLIDRMPEDNVERVKKE